MELTFPDLSNQKKTEQNLEISMDNIYDNLHKLAKVT